MPVYLSMLGILNLASKLATSIPSRSSQTTKLSDTLNCLISCSIRSIRVNIINDRGLNYCRWGNLRMTMQQIRWGLKHCQNRWWRWRWQRVMRCLILKYGGLLCWLPIFFLRLAKASWIETMAVVNWSTMTTCWFMSDISKNQTNLSSTLTQDGKAKLKTKHRSWNMRNEIRVHHRENTKEMLIWIETSKTLKCRRTVRP